MKFLLLLFTMLFAFNFLQAQTPPNDNCANAITVTVNGDCMNGSTDNATNVAPNGVACAGANTRTVWYKFVATSTSHQVSLTALSAAFDGVLAVYSGSCATLATVTCLNTFGVGFSESTLLSGLTIGNTYMIRVSTPLGSEGNFCVRILSTPSNDDCSNSIPLTVDANCTTGNNVMATATGTNPAMACGSATKSVWYHFTATTTSHYINLEQISMYASAGDPPDLGFQIFTSSGTCATLSAGLVCTNTGGNFVSESALISGFTPGNKYYIMVSGSTATSFAGFCLEVKSIPPNDLCANAINLAINATCTGGWTILAGNTAPNPASSCINNANNVWYKFTATSTNHTISLTNVTTTVDMGFAVYSGTCAAPTEIACRDALGNGGNELLTVSGLTIGNTYLVMVAGDDAVEEGKFCIQVLSPPLNDNCTAAIPLTINSVCVQGTNVNATSTPGTNPVSSCGSNTNSVWYTFTANSTSHTISVFPGSTAASTDLAFTVYRSTTQTCAGVFTEFSCSDIVTDGSGEDKTIAGLNIGETYYVMVSGDLATDFSTFCISVTSNADLCASAVPLLVNNGCVAGGNTGTTTSAGDGACQAPERTVWYSFIATATSATVTVDAALTFDSEITVFSSTGACAGLTQIGCRDIGGNGVSETVNLAGLTIGNRYYILVDGQSSDLGSYCISVRSTVTCGTNPAPANTCDSAPSISNLNGYCGVTDASYTSTFHNNLNQSSGIFCGGSASLENNSFLQFTAGGIRTTFQWTISTNSPNGGPPCDTGMQLQVYSVSGRCTTGIWTPISTCPNPTGTVGSTGSITLTGLIPGQVYYIMFDGFAGDECGYILNVLEDGVILPINLISFSGKKVTEGNLLEWTAVEKGDFQFYEIEHSTDGIIFTKIGTINPMGGNFQHEYTFIHTKTSSSNYYRLKMIDKEQRVEFSKVVYIEGHSKTSKVLAFYPNPTENDVKIDVEMTDKSDVTILIYDSKGNLMKSEGKSLNKGVQTLTVSLENFVTGLYFMQVVSNEIVIGNQKVIKK